MIAHYRDLTAAISLGSKQLFKEAGNALLAKSEYIWALGHSGQKVGSVQTSEALRPGICGIILPLSMVAGKTPCQALTPIQHHRCSR